MKPLIVELNFKREANSITGGKIVKTNLKSDRLSLLNSHARHAGAQRVI
jgi:hypothetical protein